jgi:hypothetical protein
MRDRKKQEQRFQDIEASLVHTSDVIHEGEREIERSRQIIETSETDRHKPKTAKGDDTPSP